MQFQVPQFIDTEDKIFIYFSFRQFIYIVGGVLGSLGLFLLFRYKLHLFRELAFLLAAPIAGLGIALAYVKFNGEPFEKILKAFLIYHTNIQSYSHQTIVRKPSTPEEQYETMTSHPIPNHSLEDKKLHIEVTSDNKPKRQQKIHLEI